MPELSYQKNKNSVYSIIGFIGFLLILIVYKFYSPISGTSSTSSESNPQALKDESNLSFQEWEAVSRKRANEFYECAKDVGMDNYSMVVFENCARQYNNALLEFNAGLTEKANLSTEDIQRLKDYWDKTRAEMTKKVGTLIRENDKKKRPNYYGVK